MVTSDDVRRAQRKQMYCVGVLVLCGVVWGVTKYRGGPELIHEWSGTIAMLSLLVCFLLSFAEDAKEDQDWLAENQGPTFLASYAFATAFEAAGEPSEDFRKRCEELKPSCYTVEEWMNILMEYRKKWSGKPSLV